MSHEATVWAFKQRGIGLSPSEKLVLLHLADRHNPDHGCFPKQERLAADCELSRSTINRKLSGLESKGLLRRVRRVDARTKRQLPTCYIFNFEDEFHEGGGGSPDDDANLHPNNGGQHSDAEPAVFHSKRGGNVAQLSRDKATTSEVVPTAGPAEIQRNNIDQKSEATVERFNHAREADSSAEIATSSFARFEEFWAAYPRARDKEKSRRMFGEAVNRGISPEIIIAAAKRYKAENQSNNTMYIAYSDNWLASRRWEDYPQVEPQGRHSDRVMTAAHIYAPRIKEGRYVPEGAITPQVAAAMIDNSLVTEQDLLRAGVRL